MDLTAGSPHTAPFSGGIDNYHSSVRYDYAGKPAGKYKGTVFTAARVELVMSQKDPKAKESALHIDDALNRPERTLPSWPGKSVPGAKEPPHRIIDPDKVEANRKKSIQECKKVWGTTPAAAWSATSTPSPSPRKAPPRATTASPSG